MIIHSTILMQTLLHVVQYCTIQNAYVSRAFLRLKKISLFSPLFLGNQIFHPPVQKNCRAGGRCAAPGESVYLWMMTLLMTSNTGCRMWTDPYVHTLLKSVYIWMMTSYTCSMKDLQVVRALTVDRDRPYLYSTNALILWYPGRDDFHVVISNIVLGASMNCRLLSMHNHRGLVFWQSQSFKALIFRCQIKILV
jgi:hypothetical protein